jgi:hypothetical protein
MYFSIREPHPLGLVNLFTQPTGLINGLVFQTMARYYPPLFCQRLLWSWMKRKEIHTHIPFIRMVKTFSRHPKSGWWMTTNHWLVEHYTTSWYLICSSTTSLAPIPIKRVRHDNQKEHVCLFLDPSCKADRGHKLHNFSGAATQPATHKSWKIWSKMADFIAVTETARMTQWV